MKKIAPVVINEGNPQKLLSDVVGKFVAVYCDNHLQRLCTFNNCIRKSTAEDEMSNIHWIDGKLISTVYCITFILLIVVFVEPIMIA